MGAPGSQGASDFAYHAALFPAFQSKAEDASSAVLELIDVSDQVHQNLITSKQIMANGRALSVHHHDHQQTYIHTENCQACRYII